MSAGRPAEIRGVALEWGANQVRGSEREATRVLRELVWSPDPDGLRHHVRFIVELDSRRFQSEYTLVGGPNVPGVRRVIVEACRRRLPSRDLTESVQRVLGHVADSLDVGAQALSQASPQHWAYLCGYRVRVPPMHPARRGPMGWHRMCRRTEANHRVLDYVLPWDLEAHAPERGAWLSRGDWWQRVLQDLPVGLDVEGAS